MRVPADPGAGLVINRLGPAGEDNGQRQLDIVESVQLMKQRVYIILDRNRGYLWAEVGDDLIPSTQVNVPGDRPEPGYCCFQIRSNLSMLTC